MSISNAFSLRVTPKGGTAQPDAAAMAQSGPRLPCQVRTDAKRADALKRAGKEIPPGVGGEMLIDTGASLTCIEDSVLVNLGIPRVGTTEVMTPSGKVQQGLYVCGLAFPGSGIPSINQIVVIGSDLAGQGLIGLLGRNLLAQGLLVYNGSAGTWSLAF